MGRVHWFKSQMPVPRRCVERPTGTVAEEHGAATEEIARNVAEADKGTAQVANNITDVNRGASNVADLAKRAPTGPGQREPHPCCSTGAHPYFGFAHTNR
jgi:hypothetical protein